MNKRKSFPRTRFEPEVIRAAISALRAAAPDDAEENDIAATRTVNVADAQWSFDNDDEFLSAYRGGGSAYYIMVLGRGFQLSVTYTRGDRTAVLVGAPSRAAIESVFEVFEAVAGSSREVAEADPHDLALADHEVVIFIGHGRDPQWRDLKDHLHDQHGYEVQAYEIGARAGHTIRDILEDMLTSSSFALLVLTGEDADADGNMHARENVIHEVGLFQGHLGFARAIVVLENGTHEFSNIHGIQQLRFDKGNIRSIFGDVLATLRREFGDDR